jgi:streptomycin 6-kinase
MLIPPAFAAGIEAGAGADGKARLDALPVIISELCAEWDLIPGEPLMHGYLALVVPVRRAAAAMC